MHFDEYAERARGAKVSDWQDAICVGNRTRTTREGSALTGCHLGDEPNAHEAAPQTPHEFDVEAFLSPWKHFLRYLLRVFCILTHQRWDSAVTHS